ncbi:MAG: FMN-binding glutamate synthase family protein [Polyangiaceae bacterium]|nr:FMN-binding glutamate synthase family protein [Polyangiaceae bacterium]MCE7889168.1 FMN-binding glutamate synthase family protein [Sorangiineae bacterium PRO1]MCL4755633.1 FMN-binding glutamate synthase family protein [Myxococcales bacterium]
MFRLAYLGLLLGLSLVLAATPPASGVPLAVWLLGLPVLFVGAHDIIQRRHALLRNYPLVGHFRYVLERVRPEIRQYFGESDIDGVPLDREVRSLVYRRAKGDPETVPFGTKRNLAAVGVEWAAHAMYPRPARTEEARVVVGEATSAQPYACSRLNIAAMSYGALGDTAIRALSRGARLGGFAHNTGEGGVSPHHLAGGGDLIWQLGTAYFGCRDREGRFDPEKFRDVAQHPNIKMIELKLSQGGKPGYGGVLPASKVSAEIATIRGVRQGERVMSPSRHPGIDSPVALLHFIAQLRDLSGRKPVGVKLCVGAERDVVELIEAMIKTGITLDYIVVDGAEGGTGAAPQEFTNHVGAPLEHGLVLVVDTLRRAGLRDMTKVFASGRILTGFDLLRAIALGADGCFSGRGMMLALGCIQALRCNTNDCPVGIATQDPALTRALDVGDKSVRVKRYHEATIASFHSLLGAVGLSDPSELRRGHILRRVSMMHIASLAELYPDEHERGSRDGSYADARPGQHALLRSSASQPPS